MNINPIVLSIPVFFILIGIELLVERFTHQKLYRLPDAIANISCGITSQLSGLFLRISGMGVYQSLFENIHFSHIRLPSPASALLHLRLSFSNGLTPLSLVYVAISVIWFYSLQKQHGHLQIA